MNSFGTLFHDKIFSLTVNNIPDISLTCFKFPDIYKFSRQVVTLITAHTTHQMLHYRLHFGKNAN